MFKKTVLIYLLWRFALFVGILIGINFIPQLLDVSARSYVTFNIPYFAWVHANSDGSIYTYIARAGYHAEEPGFFPLFPLLIKTVHDFFDIRYLYSGLWISNLAFIGSLFVIYKLFVRDLKKESWLFFLTLLFFYPTSFFYTAVYNDSLFLLFATLTLFFGRRKGWVFAALFGSLATLTRLNGLALIFYLLAEFLVEQKLVEDQKYKITLAKLKKSGSYLKGFGNLVMRGIYEKFIFILLIPITFTGYLYYLNWKLGDWHLLFSSMEKWQQSQMTFPLQVFYRYLKIIFLSTNFQALNYYVAIFEFLFACLYVFVLVYGWKKIAFPYWVFLAVSFLIPSLTGTFQGMPRYSLHLYPFFLCLYLLLAKRSWALRIGYFIVCISLMFFYVAFFTRGYFVA